MAAATSHLTTQLQSKLTNQNEPLDKRLEVAYTVFCSSSIPIVQKEEKVLSWVLGCLSNDQVSISEKNLLYICLSKCLKSKRMHSFNGNIRYPVIAELIGVLTFIQDYTYSMVATIRTCCVEIFDIPFFQRWFMCDVDSACKTASNYFKCILDSESGDEFPKLIKQFLYVHKLSLLKKDFSIRFIKEMLNPLCEALVHIPSEKRHLFLHEAAQCMKEVLFYDPKFMDSYINFNPSNSDDCSKEVKSFYKKIKHFPTKVDKDTVEICFSLFLETVILKYPDDFRRIFRVFTLLCPPLGIIVDRIISIEMRPVDNWEIDNSFYVIRSLIDILDKSKIPLTCQLEEVSLQNWFTSLVIGLTNINSRTMSVNFIEMVRRVYEFNPLVIEPSCKIITMIMLRKKSNELKPAYIRLIRSVVRGSDKVQRLQKFVSFFLENMKDSLMMSCEDDLTLDDVLPSEVCEEFSRAFEILSIPQVLAMTKSFLFHLQRDCANQIEAAQIDTGIAINVGVISELLNILLLNANIIDVSIPEVVTNKYKSLLEEMQMLLKLFGMVYQDVHEDRLLKAYLRICKAFGTVKLLFREYDSIQIVKPMDVDLEPTNLSYVHNYLHPDSWKSIAESIEDHEECEARYEFFELLIQKVQAVSQVEEGYEGPGTQAARYLLEWSDVKWLWSNLLTLAPLFQSAELVKLVSKVIRHFGDDQSPWLPLLKEDALTENRRMLLALEFGMLYKAAKKIDSITNEEESLSKQVLSLVSMEDILEFELSQLITEDEDLKESVEGFVSEMANLLNESFLQDRSPCVQFPSSSISMFEVPARLPIHHLSAVSQSCAVLSATALLYDMPHNNDIDMLLFNLLLKILDGPQKGNGCLLSCLNPGYFLNFVAHRGSAYRGQRKLMKRICFLAFKNKKPAKQLFSAVSDPTPSTVWITALVIDCLIQVKKKFIGIQQHKNKKPLERKKCLDHLMAEVIPILSSENPSPKLLYTFSVVFNYTLRYLHSSSENFSVLVPFLQQYITIAISDYGEGERLVEGLIEHRAELGEHFPPSLVLTTFEQMCLQFLPPPESFSHLLFGAATPDEFSSMLSNLLIETKCKEFEEDGEKCKRLFLLWSHLSCALLSNDKSRKRDDVIAKLMQHLAVIPERWAADTGHHLVEPLMKLVAAIAKNTSITLKPVVLDTVLVLLGEVPLSVAHVRDTDDERPLSHLRSTVDGMFSLYFFRTSLLIDRLPPFLQRYRRCLINLVENWTSLKCSDSSKRETALLVSEKLERTATVMMKRRKDFSRLAPYLIADIMNLCEKYSISHELENHLKNMVNIFLSVTDNHAISYLKAVLPSGQQELFDYIFESYKKFHRFVGKI